MTTKLSVWARNIVQVVEHWIPDRHRKLVIFCFVLAGMISSIAAAAPKPTAADSFALYPIVPDDALNRTFAQAFEYENVFSKSSGIESVRGLYRPEPVLTFDHIAKVGISNREIQTAPINGLHLTLNDSGARKLNEYLRQPNAKEVVVFIDGYAYATVSLALAREMADKRVLWVILPRPQEAITERFLKLLVEKLQTRMAQQRPGKN